MQGQKLLEAQYPVTKTGVFLGMNKGDCESKRYKDADIKRKSQHSKEREDLVDNDTGEIQDEVRAARVEIDRRKAIEEEQNEASEQTQYKDPYTRPDSMSVDD